MEIEERLISFETAKLAKEKGFVLPCHSYYFEDGEFKENELTGTVKCMVSWLPSIEAT